MIHTGIAIVPAKRPAPAGVGAPAVGDAPLVLRDESPWSMVNSCVSPEGEHVVPSAMSITTLQRPLAHRCQRVVMQFHWPSASVHSDPSACCRRSSLMCGWVCVSSLASAELGDVDVGLGTPACDERVARSVKMRMKCRRTIILDSGVGLV